MTASNINTDSACVSNLTLSELCWTCDRGSSLLEESSPQTLKMFKEQDMLYSS